jgi:hypothetical protein
MGCKIPKSSNIKISIINSENTSTSSNRNIDIKKYPYYSYQNTILNSYYNSYNNKLTPNLWKKVIDFLPYQDLKEVGKTNRKFNKICKNGNILIKFFKKKDDCDYFQHISFASFSQLRKFDASECNYSFFIYE